MTKFIRFFLFILFISFSSSPLFSGENALSLNLKDALKIGLKNSPELAQAEKELEKAEFDIAINRAAFYPSISLEGGYNLSRLHSSPQWNPDYHRGTVGIDWTLYDYGRRSLNLKTTKSEKYVLEEDYRKTCQNKALEITSAFLSVLKNKELVNLSEKRLKRAKKYYQLAEAKLEVGIVSYADLLKSKVEVKGAESDTISASNALSLSRIKLENVLGLKKEEYRLDSGLKFSFPLVSLEKSLSEALSKRPEIKKKEGEEIQLEYAYQLVRKDYLPSLSLKGNYDYYLNRELSGYLDTSDWTVYLALKIPIFDGGIKRSRLKQAELNREKLQFAKEESIRDITGEVSTNFFNLQNLEKLMGVQGEEVTAATENLRLATGRYKEGVGSILEVIDAQTDLVSAETDKVNTLFDYQLAKANLILSSGKNIEDYLK